MKSITAAELAGKTNFELSAIYARIREELGHAKPGSYEHDVLATSLETVRRVFAARVAKGPKP